MSEHCRAAEPAPCSPCSPRHHLMTWARSQDAHALSPERVCESSRSHKAQGRARMAPWPHGPPTPAPPALSTKGRPPKCSMHLGAPSDQPKPHLDIPQWPGMFFMSRGLTAPCGLAPLPHVGNPTGSLSPVAPQPGSLTDWHVQSRRALCGTPGWPPRPDSQDLLLRDSVAISRSQWERALQGRMGGQHLPREGSMPTHVSDCGLHMWLPVQDPGVGEAQHAGPRRFLEEPQWA